MPQPIPSLSPKEAAAVAARLVTPSWPVPERRDAIDIVGDACNEVMSDPAILTSHDAAKYILDALEAAGHRPSRRKPTYCDFNGKPGLDWDTIEMQLHHLATRVQAVEWMGRQAIDAIHSQSMGDVFDRISEDMLEHVLSLQLLLGLKEVQS